MANNADDNPNFNGYMTELRKNLIGTVIIDISYHRDRDDENVFYPVLTLSRKSRPSDPNPPENRRGAEPWGVIEIRQDDEDNGPGVPVYIPSKEAQRCMQLDEEEAKQGYGMWQIHRSYR